MPDTLVQPAYIWTPEHTSTAGGEAADLAESVGMHLDGEQRLVLDAILAERPDGKWAALEAALICSRQNGKTVALQAVVLADLFLFGSELVIWTAHQFAVAEEAFRDLKAIIEANGHLDRRVKHFNNANGDEGIELVSGQRLLFRARINTGGRGLTSDRLILDEAFKLTPNVMGSLFPTLSARPNPQVVYASSAGHMDSAVLRSVRDRGRAGGDPSLAYIEWAAPVVACATDRCDHIPPTYGCALDDHDAWQKANPAMPRRITVEYVEVERRALAPPEFARERMGWWEEPGSAAGGLPVELWQVRISPVTPGALLALAVDVNPESTWAAIAEARADGAGGTILRIAAHRRGTAWVAAEVARLRGETKVPVVVDENSTASVVATDLRAEAIDTEPTAPTARDVAQACSALLDGLLRANVWHLDQPELNAAVSGAVRRPLGDAWAWSRKNSLADICPLVAATLALWAAASPAELHRESDFILI